MNHWREIHSALSVILLLMVASPTLSEAGQEKSNASLSNSEGPKSLTDWPCDEKGALKKSKDHVERRGQDLTIWLPGYFSKESGLVFRNAARPNGDELQILWRHGSF